MTDADSTLIAALLDRSGSMAAAKEATEDGWRELIDEQRRGPGRCRVTLAQFDTEYELVYPATDIGEVPEFVLEPRGMTAMLDATATFITEVGQTLAAMPENQRPGTVICMIMTDGFENASVEWSWDGVLQLINQQRDEWNWKFLFVGANIDAVDVGSRIGVPETTSLTYNTTDDGAVAGTYARLARELVRSRSGHEMGFSTQDRAAAMGEST
jgi:hypothetical protein